MSITKRSLLLGLVLLGTIASARADVIKGRVVDAQNNPVADADVLVQSTRGKTYLDKFSVLRADAKGDFSADLPQGHYGYYGQFFAVAPGMAPDSIRLQSNSNDKVNIIQLQPAKTISGTVEDQNGKAVAGITVQLRSLYNKSTFMDVFLVLSPWENRYRTQTDKNGHWQLKGVPEGAQASVRFTDQRFTSMDIQSFINKPSTIRLQPGATFTGRVVDAIGKPEADVKVIASGHGNIDSWSEATTASDGSYQLTGLSTGSYDIIVDAGDKPLVAAAIENQTAHEGKIEKLPNLVLTSGGIITGQVLNSKTGKPIDWATVGCYGPQRPRSGSITSDDTDAGGRYSLRVAPGKSFVYVAGVAPEYIQKYNDGETVAVKEGETVTQNLEVTPGAVLSGTLVDRKGTPVANAKIDVETVMPPGKYIYDRQTSWFATTDNGGHWSVQGLPSDPVNITALSPWTNIKPVQVIVPNAEDVRVAAENIDDLPPQARVVDRNNDPLPNVQLLFLYKDVTSQLTSKQAISDAKGYARVQFPEGATSVKLSNTTAPGYTFASGGVWNPKTKTFSDIVLDKLDNTVHGIVLNQQGKPEPGASVWVAGFDSATGKTDKKGAFTLTGLPHQDITLLAIGKTGVNKTTIKSDKPVTLHLSPLPQNHFPSKAQSLDMLEKIYHETTSKTYYAHDTIAYEIAQHDLQRGLNLLKNNQGKLPADQIYGVMLLLEEKDPAKALQFGKDHLAEVTKDDDRVQVLCEMAKLANQKDKSLAQKYFSEAVKIAQIFPAPREKKAYNSNFSSDMVITPAITYLYSRVELAGAAAVVRPDQTHQWMLQIYPYSLDSHGSGGDYDWVRDAMAQSLGANAPQETESLVKNATGRTKATVLKSAIEAAGIAKKNDLAERWLKQLLALYKNGDTENPTYYASGSIYDVGQSVRLVIEAVGPKDPAHALQLARLVDDPSETAQSLMVAAYYQPKQTKLKTLKEAFELQWPVSSYLLSRTAGLIYDIDPAQGKVLFDRLLERYDQQQQDSLAYINQRLSGPNLAYFLARYKPLTSWQVLQNEYAKDVIAAKQTDSRYTDVVIAMSVLNFDEAMNWARQLTAENDKNYDAQRKLLQLALATPEVRRTLRIDRLGASDTWSPGEPANW